MAYTPDQVAKINATRSANSDAGINPYSGAGVTAYSASQGLGSLNSASLAPQPNLTLPPPPPPTNFNGAVANGNAVIGANGPSIAPPATDTGSQDPFQSLMSQYIGAQPTPPSATDTYNQLYGASGIDQAQTDLNAKNASVKAAQARLMGVTASLQGINAEATAATLQADNRQAPTFAIAGEQGAIDRARAIKAIPLQIQALAAQAEVASAQGDAQLSASILAQAKDHLDTSFQLHTQDAQAQYAYKRDVLKSVYDFATAQEQRKLDAQSKKDDKAFQLQVEDIRYQHDVAKTKLEAALRPKAAPSSNLEFIAATANQPAGTYNKATGVFTPLNGAAPSTPQGTADQLSFLRKTTADATKLARYSGPSKVTKFLGDTFVGSSGYRQLEAQTNTLRTNALTLMTDPSVKKFFGPQMSNADVQLMTAAGTTLNPENQTPAQMTAEIKRLDDLFARMQSAVQQGSAKSTTSSGASFDYAAAKAAGYSDAAITEYLKTH